MYDGGDFSAQSILENKGARVLYFAVLIILIMMIVWHLKIVSSKSSEHYYGYGMPDSYQVLASGPDVRFQEFTGTNQGETPVNMATVKQMYPGIVKGKGRQERLTAMREYPAFYDISDTLGAYQYASQYNCTDGSIPMPVRDQHGNMTYACGDGKNPLAGGQSGLDPSSMTGSEHATSSPATAVQEALLMNQLGY